MMILGMTGTRNRVTDQQLGWLNEQMKGVDELHHGACVGADHAAHRVALMHRVYVVVHPPTDHRLRIPMGSILSVRGGVAVLNVKAYLDRNRDIVDACDRVIACPDGPERPNGGTWYTVRYAMKVGKPVDICYPDGTVEHRAPELT